MMSLLRLDDLAGVSRSCSIMLASRLGVDYNESNVRCAAFNGTAFVVVCGALRMLTSKTVEQSDDEKPQQF
jgi:hypothetical protein